MRLAITSPSGYRLFLKPRSRNDSGAACGWALSLLLVAFLAAEPLRADDGSDASYPYKAVIARDRTQLRCGPGDDHYATEDLERGTEVEVFRRAEEGWLAIRPPKSSFSWVAQRDIDLPGKSDTGRVVGTAAVSWIGSGVQSVADHRWLVKLDRGESVIVLGQERRQMVSSGRSDLYYKIAPPAGEFRWLHEDDLVADDIATTTVIKDPEVELADFRVALRGSRRGPAAAERAPAAPNEGSIQAPARPSPVEESTVHRRDDFVSRDKPAASADRSPQLSRSGPRERVPSVANNARRAERTPTELEFQLRELEAQLSLAVVQPASSWQLDKLRTSAEQLAANGQSTLDRARVQLYLDKLAEFEELKSRHAMVASQTAANGSTAPSRSTESAKPGSKLPSDSSPDPRFDGTGWLLPVHSSKTTSPPFALLDSDGTILQFVSPAPGLNLNRYLRKEIGVFGQRDLAPTLDKPHLTAQRIVELDRHRK